MQYLAIFALLCTPCAAVCFIPSRFSHGLSGLLEKPPESTQSANSADLLATNDQYSQASSSKRARDSLCIICAAVAMIRVIDNYLWTPSRAYSQEDNSVGREYDAWAKEGILEHYWGEHIHLGYYESEDQHQHQQLLRPYKKDFIQAKQDFVENMLHFSKFVTSNESCKVLDVGCGIGGSSRYLAKKLGNRAQITGITLSSVQAQRATQLSDEQEVRNAAFHVMDALTMPFPDNTFDLVWACESGEHMPDKAQYVREMVRVLKPGGKLVIATWCQRDDRLKAFSEEEKKMLHFLYAEWTHPYFISIAAYEQHLQDTGMLTAIKTEDWTTATLPSWMHSIWVGVCDPWPVIRGPGLWLKTLREAVTLARMHRAFKSGLMQYGMMTATKKTVI